MKLSLKAVRVNAGLTQAELADKMGISTATLYLWENDKVSPQVSQLQKLCDIVGCSITDIFFSEER